MLSRKNRGKLLCQLRDYGIYGYVLLFVISFVVDHLVNSLRQSVQFFIISDKYQEIDEAINEIADRGCSILNGSGFFTKKDIKVIFCIAKRSESSFIFELINEIDPNAFVAQSAVVGVYGQGFDRVKNHRKLNLKELKERVANENSTHSINLGTVKLGYNRNCM